MLSLDDEILTPGVEVVSLELELLDVAFPLELAGGAERFQRHPTRLERLELHLHPTKLLSRISQTLAARDSAFSVLGIYAERGLLTVEAAVATGDGATPLLVTLAMAPDEQGALRLLFDRERRFGSLPPSLSLLATVADAIDSVLATLPGGARCELRSPGELRVDLIGPVLWALLPSRGFKLPKDRGRPIVDVNIDADGRVQIVAADGHDVPVTSSEGSRRTMKIMARLDGGGPIVDVEGLIASGEPVAAFRELRAALDDSGGPSVVVERLLAIGAGDPRLYAECADLAADVLVRRPSSAPALLALAAIDAAEGAKVRAADAYEQAAAILERRGERHAAGVAYFSAATQIGDSSPIRRAVLLQHAADRAPTSAVILTALIEAQAEAGQAAEAVRSARALAKVATDPATEADAHVLAGELLRTELSDPVQAKRSHERALRAVPGHPRALEGLAMAVVAGGGPPPPAPPDEGEWGRDGLAEDAPRAARLSLALGDVFRPRDPQAALRRYRRAANLAPEADEALENVVDVAMELGDGELALSTAELLLARSNDPQGQVEHRLRVARICAEALDRPTAAVDHLEAARELAPASLDVLSRLADLYERAGHAARADEVMGRWVEVLLSGDDVIVGLEVLVRRAKIRHAAGMDLRPMQEGLQIAEREIGAVAPLLDAAIEVARLGGAHDREASLIERRLRFELDEDERSTLLSDLGVALARAGRDADALRVHEEALELSPALSASLAAVRGAYRQRGDLDRLARVLAAAAAVTSTEARERLLAERARVLAELGRDEAALEAATEAGGDQLLGLSAALALELGRFEEARVLCDRRRRVAAGAPPIERLAIELDRAQAAEGLGDEPELIRALSAALDLAAALDDGGRRWNTVAARLAEELGAMHRWRELAELERRRSARPGLSPQERAAHLLAAADLWRRVQLDRRADADLERAFELIEAGDSTPLELEEVLSRLERAARRTGDPQRLVAILDHRARFATEEDELLRYRLEQVELLRAGGFAAEAVERLESLDLGALSTSVDVLRRLAEVASSAQRPAVAARLWARAAELATGDDAIELHDRAAAALLEVGEGRRAIAHQRRRIELSSVRDPAVAGLLDGLEQFARAESDLSLLVWILERRGASRDGAEAAALWYEAARLRVGSLDDGAGGIAAAARAVAAAPSDAIIRQFHLELLRTHGTIEDRVAALEAAAGRVAGDDAGRLLIEAAEVLLDREDDERALMRGLSIVRRAADKASKAAPALRKLCAYARQLDRPDDEIDSLGRLLEASDDGAEQLISHLRRIELIHTRVVDSVRAQAEWQLMMPLADRLDEAMQVRLSALLESADYLAIKFDASTPVRSALLLGLDLTEINESWDVHVGCLRRLLDITVEARVRADLHAALGEVEEWKRGQGDAAEREYLAALAVYPDHEDSREALTSLYLAADRFGDLADHVGIDVLREAWEHFGADGPSNQAVAAGEALWPRLPTASDERAEVQLALADLYLADDAAEGAVLLLEHVRRHAPSRYRDVALDRLRQVFEENERWDLYADVLGRQAQRASDDPARAVILAELGETLEWKLGDGAAAEQEYRSALAADGACAAAKNALIDLLAAQDRYAELGADVGPNELRTTLAKLLDGPEPEAERARKAVDALLPLLSPPEQGEVWIYFAEHVSDAEHRRFALESAVRLPGEHRKQAFEGLDALLTHDEDAAGRANLLRVRIENEESAPVQVSLRLALAAVLGRLATDAEGPARSAIDGEIEDELSQVLKIDSTNEVARAGLKEIFVRQGLYSKVADVLGSDALRDTSDVQAEATQERTVAALRAELTTAPRQPELIESLARRLLEGPDTDAALGPVAVARHLSRGSSLPFRVPPIISAPVTDELLFERLAVGMAREPFGRALASTALELAAEMPLVQVALHALDDVAPEAISDEARHAIADVVRLGQMSMSVAVDATPGNAIVVTPGSPPRLVVPELLPVTVTTTELRFRVGVAVMEARLGAIAGHVAGGARPWLDLMCALPRSDAADRVPYEMADAIERLRAKLGESRVAELSALGPEPPTDGAIDDWQSSVRTTARRFGLLVAGDLEVAARCVQGAGEQAASDLLSFLVGEDYLALIRALTPGH